MTETQQFIEDAIKGGWENRHYDDTVQEAFRIEHYKDCWIDPTFWQAVGKTRGWDNGEHVDPTYEFASSQTWMWQWKWHRFIDHLTGGLTIEEALKAIR